jgi:tetratricopeptide (TPR) repeat protein
MHCFANTTQLLSKLLSTFALLLACAGASAGTSDDLDDAAARLQYAFYTADVRGLDEVLKLVESMELDTPAGMREYQLAYGQWKLAQLYADPSSQDAPVPHASSLAAKAAEQCVKHAREATHQDSRLAEAYALEAICAGMPQGFLRLPGLRGARCEKSKPLKTAQELAPANPRVQLITALCASGKPEKTGNEVAKWLHVVAAFESAPPSGPGTADWGHAEALTLLGESYMQRGESVPARDALERALVLAPDYRQAQRMLAGAASRPR